MRRQPRCIGCGYCCDSGPCALAPWTLGLKTLFRWHGCPYLYFDGVRHWCSIHRLRRLAKRLGVVDPGDHCLMPNNPRRTN